MYVTDEDFTKKYLMLLEEFMKFLVYRTGQLPPSHEQGLQTYIQHIYNQIKQACKNLNQNKFINLNLSIEPNLVFVYKNPIDKKRKYHVALGGQINIQGNVLKDQSLCVSLMLEHTNDCDEIDESYKFYDAVTGFHVLRRFHFDYDSDNDDKVKPRFHLQYGGKFNKNYLPINNVHYKLFTPIDYPRLPQQPQDLIILLDFIFREFNLAGNEIVQEKRWISLLVESEKLWLEPYYKKLLDRLNSAARSSPLHRLT